MAPVNRQTDSGISYLFRHGWGDCPAGCLHNEYWYFIVENGAPSFLGHRAADAPEPEWWDEAESNLATC